MGEAKRRNLHKAQKPQSTRVTVTLGSGPPTAATQRHMENLSEAIDHVIDSDRIFFEEHPDRTCRLRRMHPIEVDQFRLAAAPEKSDQLLNTKPGYAHFALVVQMEPGARQRLNMKLPTDTPVDMAQSEAQCLTWRDEHFKAMARDFAQQGR